ncbi:hypothetical protein [Caballeronia sp. 15715]
MLVQVLVQVLVLRDHGGNRHGLENIRSRWQSADSQPAINKK